MFQIINADMKMQKKPIPQTFNFNSLTFNHYYTEATELRLILYVINHLVTDDANWKKSLK